MQARCQHWKLGLPITGSGYCWSCNRKAMLALVNKIIEQRRKK
jgi:hypothetical protein